MAYQIEIKLLGFPTAGTAFGFTVRVNNTVFLEVAKTFGSSGSANVIVPGSSLTTAVTAVRNNLAVNNAVTGVVYTVTGNSVFVTLPEAGYIAATDNLGTPDYVSVYLHDPEMQGMAAVNIHTMSIEIIDTYENGRSLIEEYTQVSSPKLVWDGGDDIYNPMMPSNIVFNMAVADAADAKFLHLLTGDEKRYLVKVRNEDTHGLKSLLWQGFILPDLYSEPWKSGVPFIEFTAIDMLASLKTKEFDPWFYQNTFNLPELFGYILLQTGLQQEMYIKPGLVNVSNPDYRFRDLNINLRMFIDGKKYTKLYDMLEKLLTALGMCIYSYRGKWFIEGVTRRYEGLAVKKNVAEIYHPDGVYKGTTGVGFKTLAPDFMKEVPTLTVNTPWKRVNVDYDSDSEGLYPAGVLVKEYMSTEFIYDNKSNSTFSDNYMDNWRAVGIPYMRDAVAESLGLSHELELRVNDSLWGSAANYNVTEAMAVASYFDCTIKPWAAKERIYELEYEVEVSIATGYEGFEGRLNVGLYDSFASYQLFNGTDEIISNRPTYVGRGLFLFDKSIINASGENVYQVVSFRLKCEFLIANPGYLTFRILPGIQKLSDLGVTDFIVRPKVLQITAKENLENLESTIAERDINYTQELDVDIDITCTVDSIVAASFGIGARSGNRFFRINTDAWVDFQTIQKFLPATDVGLDLRRWPITKFIQDYIFIQDNQKAVFMERAGQKAIEYASLYSWNLAGVPFMAVYTGFVRYAGNPLATPSLPEGYKPLPGVLPSDNLILMASLFPEENKSLRALWKIDGFPDASADTYVKTLARACHAVRPDVCFSLDATALDLIFPEHRPVFVYNGENRVFVPVRMELDLSEGKTNLTMVEWKLQNVNDISYE